MTFDDVSALAGLLASGAVVASLLFVGVQLRQQVLVSKAGARHDISAFAL